MGEPVRIGLGAAVFALTAMMASAGYSDTPPTFVTSWGEPGMGPGQFNGARDIALDDSGNVYVVDSQNNRIQRFAPNGVFLSQWGSEGRGDGQLFFPEHIAIFHDRVYVSENLNERVQTFTLDGLHVGYLAILGTPPGPIDVDANGNVFLVLPEVPIIGKLSSAGALLTTWGTAGSGPGQFESPSGICVDRSNGEVWVTDGITERVQRFSNDGTYEFGWAGPPPLAEFGAVEVDGAGHIYLTWNSQVTKYDRNGNVLTSFGGPGFGNGQFSSISALVLCHARCIYVSDSVQNRIQQFDYDVGIREHTWGRFKALYSVK